MYREHFTVETVPMRILNITQKVNELLEKSQTQVGLCHLFIKHTSASLLISENSDPNVLKDLRYFMENLVPQSRPYLHHLEGPDDMPAHIRAVLTQMSITLPVQEGKLDIGLWQAVYLWEHRDKPHQREIVLSVMDG